MSRARGFTVMEVVTTMAILSILLGASLTGGDAHRQTIGAAFDRLDASLAAASHLEQLRPADITSPGTRVLALDARVESLETTTTVAPGLFEVRVTVRTPDGVVLTELATRIAREVTK